jgi:hypothetical protein
MGRFRAENLTRGRLRECRARIVDTKRLGQSLRSRAKPSAPGLAVWKTIRRPAPSRSLRRKKAPKKGKKQAEPAEGELSESKPTDTNPHKYATTRALRSCFRFPLNLSGPKPMPGPRLCTSAHRRAQKRLWISGQRLRVTGASCAAPQCDLRAMCFAEAFGRVLRTGSANCARWRALYAGTRFGSGPSGAT